ncbi:sensor histidine kinase [Stutzerimonas chloritidismutans]|uniref:sensor histidine kinase n=1 Tax=Stutzerimonas chloritidismutans TaxID=203192 RepID=UPI003F16FDDD
MPVTVRKRRLRRLLLPVLALLLVLGCGYVTFVIGEHAGIERLAESGERQLELHARAVESEISKYIYLPSLLELDEGVRQLLQQPGDRGRQREVNRYLQGLNERGGSLAVYVLDRTGHVVATSNWLAPDSYMGEDLSFRPYYQDAIAGLPGRFYGIGSTRGEAGYYLAHGLADPQGSIYGVAVVKVRLDTLEQRWKRAQVDAYISDENGVIILSSDPAMRLKSIRPLSLATRERLANSLQYSWWRLDELRLRERDSLGDGLEQVRYDDSLHDAASAPLDYLSQSLPLEDTPWHLTLLAPLEDERRNALSNAMLAAAGCALLIVLLIVWNQRRKVISTRLDAREALERANRELELRIDVRTADLCATNERLKAEIRERLQAEQTLRLAQDELVRSGKLAVIGQMSTNLAHEINQPLAALRTLSANAVRFLQRGAIETASTNLESISELVDRIGKITGSLRSFARGTDDTGHAQLHTAIEASLLMLHPRLEAVRPEVTHDYEPVTLPIDQTRLEQILVNLIANALDALRGQPEPRLWLTGREQGDEYLVEVRDNGPGIPPQARDHLFELFYTTKPGDAGLGLGLTLSASLAAAANGTLAVTHPPGGGAAFILTLPRVTQCSSPDSRAS